MRHEMVLWYVVQKFFFEIAVGASDEIKMLTKWENNTIGTLHTLKEMAWVLQILSKEIRNCGCSFDFFPSTGMLVVAGVCLGLFDGGELGFVVAARFERLFWRSELRGKSSSFVGVIVPVLIMRVLRMLVWSEAPMSVLLSSLFLPCFWRIVLFSMLFFLATN